MDGLLRPPQPPHRTLARSRLRERSTVLSLWHQCSVSGVGIGTGPTERRVAFPFRPGPVAGPLSLGLALHFWARGLLASSIGIGSTARVSRWSSLLGAQLPSA